MDCMLKHPMRHPEGDAAAGDPGRTFAGESAADFASRTTADPAQTRAFAIAAARLCDDDKCTHVRLLDVRTISQVTDYIVIASGTSERQMRSVLEHIRELGEEAGFPAFRISTDTNANWLLADFVDVVVHLFEPDTRLHYDLETLWGDAQRVEWNDGSRHRKTDPDESVDEGA